MTNQSYFPNQLENQSFQSLASNQAIINTAPVLNLQYSNVLNSGTNVTFPALNPTHYILTPPVNPSINSNPFSANVTMQYSNLPSHQNQASQPNSQTQQNQLAQQSQHNKIEQKQGYDSTKQSTQPQTEWEKQQAELQQKIQSWSKQHTQFVGTNLQQYQGQKVSTINSVSVANHTSAENSVTANAHEKTAVELFIQRE